MAINTSNQLEIIKALTSVAGGARSWTGNSGQSATIRYTFDHTKNFAGNNSLRELYADEKSAAKEAMKYWQNVCNVSFAEATAAPYDLVLSGDSFLASAGKAIRTYSSSTPSKIINADLLYNDIGLAEGESGFQTFVHELGHAIGLSHPNDSGDNLAYDQSTTTMSYNLYKGLWSFMPMIYDIAAAQYLYGANTLYNNGITNYNSAYITGEKQMWTIWDAGGEDTIDVSQLAIAADKIKIDLRGGVDAQGKVRFSEIGDERIAIALDPSKNWETPIEIEHAKGSINVKNFAVGNAANNKLTGGNQRDTIIGGYGIDELKGEDDKDILVADNGYAKREFDVVFTKPAAPIISNSFLYGGKSTDLLVAGGDESRLYGGTEQDIYAVASGAFIEDGTGEDYATVNSIKLPGGVKPVWSESPYVYYGGFSAAFAGSPSPTANLLSALTTLIELPLATIVRYAITVSGQLLIDFGRGRAGQAIVQDYDYLEGTAGITVFQGVLGQFSKEKYTQFVKLALKAAGLEMPGTDPLVLDMDGDGIELSRVGAHNSVYFDQDGNGFAENMGWVKADDALPTPQNDNILLKTHHYLIA